MHAGLEDFQDYSYYTDGPSINSIAEDGLESEVDSNNQSTEVWDVTEADFLKDFAIQPEAEAEMESQINSTLDWMLLYLLIWASKYSVSASAMHSLISFLHYVFTYLGEYAPFIRALAALFPTSLYIAQKYFKLEKDNFTKYVVCPACHSNYLYENCFYKTSNGKDVPKTCSYVAFPQHPVKSKRQQCGHNLLRKVVLQNGDIKYYPLKVYCYSSIVNSLKIILSRPGMETLCDHWKSRVVPQNTLGDIYDGSVWKELKGKDGNLFFF